LLELFVEDFAVVREPVLDGFKQIAGKVCLIALWVAMFYDVVEPLDEELLVGMGCDGQSAFV
jgi:hypothetical protein